MKRLIYGPCWEWAGYKGADGYGRVNLQVDGRWAPRLVHRVVYEALVGPIPDGLVSDHLCRNHACYNPAHIEPVTSAENTRRGNGGWNTRAKTHCPQGHEYSDANTRRYQGRRWCRACDTAGGRRARTAKRSAA